MFNYPVSIAHDDDGSFFVTFADLPGATFGETEADALAHAVDALESALQALISDRKDIPPASPVKGCPTVAPSVASQFKLELYLAMRARGWRKADLARVLDVETKIVDRLLDLRHKSTLQQLEAALRACGRRAEVQTFEMAA